MAPRPVQGASTSTRAAAPSKGRSASPGARRSTPIARTLLAPARRARRRSSSSFDSTTSSAIDAAAAAEQAREAERLAARARAGVDDERPRRRRDELGHHLRGLVLHLEVAAREGLRAERRASGRRGSMPLQRVPGRAGDDALGAERGHAGLARRLERVDPRDPRGQLVHPREGGLERGFAHVLLHQVDQPVGERERDAAALARPVDGLDARVELGALAGAAARNREERVEARSGVLASASRTPGAGRT